MTSDRTLEPPGVHGGMLLRVWDRARLLRTVPWLRFKNREGRHIYIRPKSEHNLSLVNDLTADAAAATKREGFHPAVVVGTSPANFQAWTGFYPCVRLIEAEECLSFSPARALPGYQESLVVQRPHRVNQRRPTGGRPRCQRRNHD